MKFNILTNEIQHTISKDAEKASDKIETFIPDKNSKETRNRRRILQPKKGIYEKPTVNILHNGERLNAHLPKIRNN